MKSLFAFILLSSVSIAGCNTAPATNQPASQSQPAQLAQSANKVTAANFAKLKTGMTLQQAEALLGKAELLSESEVAGIKSAVYIWRQPGSGGNITVAVQNGAVVSKAQFGLK